MQVKTLSIRFARFTITQCVSMCGCVCVFSQLVVMLAIIWLIKYFIICVCMCVCMCRVNISKKLFIFSFKFYLFLYSFLFEFLLNTSSSISTRLRHCSTRILRGGPICYKWTLRLMHTINIANICMVSTKLLFFVLLLLLLLVLCVRNAC